jgi:hypothetical protein
MPFFRINIKEPQKGMIFNAGRTKAAAKRMIIQVNEDIAQEGVDLVRAHLRGVLRKRTGFYESRIAVQRKQIYRGVWDQRVAKGGWLEGVDRRNKTSRFKGYFTFRLVKGQLQSQATRIAQPAVDKFVHEMNR